MLLIPDVELRGNTEDKVRPILGGPSLMLPVVVSVPLSVGSGTNDGNVVVVLPILTETLRKIPEDRAASDVGKPLLMPLVISPLGVGMLPVLIRDELVLDVEDRVGSAVGCPSRFVADDSPVMVGPASSTAVIPQQEQAEE